MSTTTTTSIQEPLNELVWISIRPVLKLAGPATAGFILAKANLLSPIGSRSVSQIILNVTLPSLLFSKIIVSINSSNVGSIGVIVLTSLVYMSISIIFSLLIRRYLKVPNNFRWGIIAAAGWSNSGDLPTSVISTITLSAPFNGIVDSNLAIAYVAIFILVFYVTMFPMNGAHLIARDYLYPIKDSEDEETLPRDNKKNSTSNDKKEEQDESKGEEASNYLRSTTNRLDKGVSTQPFRSRSQSFPNGSTSSSTLRPHFADSAPLGRITSNRSTRSIGTASIRELAGAAAGAAFEDTSIGRRKFNLKTIVGSRTNSILDIEEIELDGTTRCRSPLGSIKSIEESEETLLPTLSISQRIKNGTIYFLRSLATPPTISLTLALLFALVKDLKALFVYDPTISFHPLAPDSLPPLAIILETASFIGAASVPLGLMVLGSALARMRLPRPISRLPLSSIVALAVAKLIFLPIIAYFFVEALTNYTSLVDKENKVLRFTLIYFGALPTATTQVNVRLSF